MPNESFRQNFHKGLKQKNGHNHQIFDIRISLSTRFQLKLTILFFSARFAQKRVFPVYKRRSEHHHSTLDFQISLGTKFQLKLTI